MKTHSHQTQEDQNVDQGHPASSATHKSQYVRQRQNIFGTHSRTTVFNHVRYKASRDLLYFSLTHTQLTFKAERRPSMLSMWSGRMVRDTCITEKYGQLTDRDLVQCKNFPPSGTARYA
jgi:hypothetical protein